ncbi:MAG: glycosyltransferase family 9 protein [Nitrospirota bacterium]|nr:glycosyltransferase family 9 protein [Nitrospirota bacterium]
MATYQRILIIRYGGLGDFILTLPLLAALREISPGGHVTFMGKREFASLAEGVYIDAIESVEKHGISTFFIKDGELDPGLSEFFASFDLILSFRTDHEGIFAANLRRVAKGRVVVSSPSPDKTGVHASDFLLSALDQADIDWKQFPAPVPLLPFEAREKGDIIAIHPGSGSAAKCWSVDRYIELAGRVEGETKLRPVLIFGPAEEGIRHRVGWHFSAYDNREIHEVASFLKGCRAHVGNDSGITHLAAALGVPTLALFGPTDPAVWAPRGAHVKVLEGEADCAPCTEEERRQCRNRVCLDSLTVDTVYGELVKLTAEN